MNQVKIVIKSILSNYTVLPSPVKVIRLGRNQAIKLRPLKMIFYSISDAFDTLKNKKNLSADHPLINVSSDRISHQRGCMKNCINELTIKFMKEVPKIVIKSELAKNSSLNNKRFFINLNLNSDFLFLSETWLNEKICDAELGLYGFNIFRMDRENSNRVREGGVLLAIHQKYCCTRILTQILGNINQVFVLVKFRDSNL